MKKVSRFFAVMALGFLALTGCQNEAFEVIDPPADEVIAANSNVANLIQRVSMKDGSGDNIVDSASCVSIALPFRVFVNGLEVVIDSEEDLEIIKEIFDEFDEDDDLLEIIFPITVVLPDHSEIHIEDEDALEDLVEDCLDDQDDDIECLDFDYPIRVSIYDTVNQTSSVIVLDDDRDMYDLLEHLDEDDLVGFDFPIVVILADGTEIVIHNNDELEDIIEDTLDDCDEDDDDHNDMDDGDQDDDHADTVIVSNLIIEGTWIVANYNDSGTNETGDFEGYTLTFSESGTVIATNGEVTIDGTWNEITDDGKQKLVLDFGNDMPFDELNDDWDIEDVREDRIELHDISGGDGTLDVLVFERL